MISVFCPSRALITHAHSQDSQRIHPGKGLYHPQPLQVWHNGMPPLAVKVVLEIIFCFNYCNVAPLYCTNKPQYSSVIMGGKRPFQPTFKIGTCHVVENYHLDDHVAEVLHTTRAYPKRWLMVLYSLPVANFQLQLRPVFVRRHTGGDLCYFSLWNAEPGHSCTQKCFGVHGNFAQIAERWSSEQSCPPNSETVGMTKQHRPPLAISHRNIYKAGKTRKCLTGAFVESHCEHYQHKVAYQVASWIATPSQLLLLTKANANIPPSVSVRNQTGWPITVLL